MNKTQVLNRSGWTANRVEKFIVVEHEHNRRGYYGNYVEYEYSEQQVVSAEQSEEWLAAAAKYLRMPGLTYEALLADRVATKLRTEEAFRCANALSIWLSPNSSDSERLEARQRLSDGQIESALEGLRDEALACMEADFRERRKQEEIRELAVQVRGGLMLAGYSHPLSDGWRTFSPAQVLPFIEMRERSESDIDSEWIADFYTLWKSGEGYCNPLGSLRKLINPCKRRLIDALASMAKKKKWKWGIKSGVVYFDTPCGQVSFHLHWSTPISKAPAYEAEWSGKRDSQEILEAFFSDEDSRRHIAQSEHGASRV